MLTANLLPSSISSISIDALKEKLEEEKLEIAVSKLKNQLAKNSKINHSKDEDLNSELHALLGLAYFRLPWKYYFFKAAQTAVATSPVQEFPPRSLGRCRRSLQTSSMADIKREAPFFS